MKRFRRLLFLARTSLMDGWKRAAFYKKRAILGAQGQHCYFANRDFGTEPFLVAVGDNVYIAAQVKFITHDISVKMLMNYDPSLDIENIRPIRIGSNVFLGLGTLVCPGAAIGSDVIVGAGSVVVGKLEGGYVYAGSPAKKIRRFEEHVERLRRQPNIWNEKSPGESKEAFLKRFFQMREER